VAGAARRSGAGALLVGLGILLSRLMGLARDSVFAYHLGNSPAAAAFKAALRIPNFLQNLFGEGVLSASFIPVYARLLGQEDREEAGRVAGAVFGLLALTTSALTLLGMLLTPQLIDLVVPGFEGELRATTIHLVRILFPGTGLLVASAWCLGILNSHRRFFLSYAAPVLWNLAQIAALLAFGPGRKGEALVEVLAWAATVGSALQFGVQLPSVLSLLGRFRPSLDLARASARRVLTSFPPVLLGRGVVQISAYVDLAIASLITARAFSALDYVQRVYLIPVSLFGMAVSAAELPEMARATGGTEEIHREVRERVASGGRRIAFLVVPSAAAFFFLGDMVAAPIWQRGQFGPADTRYAWYLLMASAVGLLASTLGRLYSSAFYALQDTRTPLRFAAVRVAAGAGLAFALALGIPEWTGVPEELGAAGITVASGVAAWLELALLRRALERRVGRAPGVTAGVMLRLWGAAAAGAAAGLLVKLALVKTHGAAPGVAQEWHGDFLPAPAMNVYLGTLLVVAPFGLLYFAITWAMKVPESRAVVGRLLRRPRAHG
jgi:putative peptidoglycan lipid II flippase